MPSSWQKVVYTPPICIMIRLPFDLESGESNRPLTPILLKSMISIVILLQKYAILLLAESSIYTTNLYHDTPPICIAILLQKY